MKRVLFVSNTANFSKFNRPFMRWFHEQGWRVDYCSAGEEAIADCDNSYAIPIARSPFSLSNIRALTVLKKLLRANAYDLIHCHTPMGGVLARLAAASLPHSYRPRLMYTAHGFHFYRGAPLINWLLYYPMEKYLAHHTDALVTINEEDFSRAQKALRSCKAIYYLDGVGVDLGHFKSRFSDPDFFNTRQAVRRELGLHPDDFILLYVAEFIPRKNHRLLFQIMPELCQCLPSLKLVLAGSGEDFAYWRAQASTQGLPVHFAGYTHEVEKYTQTADLYVSPANQEGLPVSIIEAMASGLAVIASDIRGHRDIITEGENGFLCSLKNGHEFAEKIRFLYTDPEQRERMGRNNARATERYSLDKVLAAMKDMYQSLM